MSWGKQLALPSYSCPEGVFSFPENELNQPYLILFKLIQEANLLEFLAK